MPSVRVVPIRDTFVVVPSCMPRAQWSLILIAALALTSCIPVDQGCCGSLGRISNVATVVDGRVVEIVSEDSLLIEVDGVRGADVPSDSLPIGERIEVASFFDEYELDGNELTFFLSTGGISELRLGIAYVHDRATDEPVTGFPDEASPYGVTVDGMLDCLVTEHETGAADQPRLAALVLETTREPKLEDLCVSPQVTE